MYIVTCLVSVKTKGIFYNSMVTNTQSHNHTLHSLPMVHYQWIIHYTQYIMVHTSVVPMVMSYVPDHHHLQLDTIGHHYSDTTSGLIQ